MHGWLIAASLREMAGLGSEANFDSEEIKFPFKKKQTMECGSPQALDRNGDAETLERGKGMEGKLVFTSTIKPSGL